MSNSKIRKIYKYYREYKWSNVFQMIKNSRLQPKICYDDFTGKNVVITGATSGIGYFTAKEYASKGANLICINRNREKSEKLKSEIENQYNVKCEYWIADLSNLSDIKNIADKLNNLSKDIDILIHNAGIYLTKKEMTSDGLEKVFVVNHLSAFIINYKLLNKFKSQGKGRIILVSSEGHRFTIWGLRTDDLNWEKRRYTGLRSYGASKTAQLLTMMIFNKKLQGSGVTINAVHPGIVTSESGKENGKIYRCYRKNFLDKFLQPTDVASKTLYYIGVSKELEGVSGKFFNMTTEEIPAPPAKDYKMALKIWDKSLELANLSNDVVKI